MLVIFDLDDTLLHLNVDWPSVKKEVIALARSKGIEIDESKHIIYLANELSSSLKHEIDAIFLEHESRCVDSGDYEAFGPMIELVKRMDGHRLALVSGNCTKTIEKALSDLGILEKFEFICGRDKVSVGKPDPEGVLMVLAELKAGKDDVLFIGDSIVDEQAAVSAGIRFYRVRDPGKDAEAIRKLI